jgi:hypothetical protein
MKTLILALIIAACPHYWHHHKVIYMKDWYKGKPISVDTLKEAVVYERESFVPDSCLFVKECYLKCDSCQHTKVIKKTWIKPDAILKPISK